MRNDGADFDEILEYKSSVPERHLLAAILTRAIWDVIKAEDRKEALIWFFKKDKNVPFESDRTGFTFLEICETLDLDSDTILKSVKAMAIESDRQRTLRCQTIIDRFNHSSEAVA